VTPAGLAAPRELLALVLDTLVPAGGEFPGAGGVALDHVAAMAAASGELASLLSQGLLAVEAAAQAEGASGFARLSTDDREQVLRRVERSHPEFFEALVRQTYDGYYSHPLVVERLGLEPRPLHPHGHKIEATELPDLSRVAGRGPIYRQP